MLEQYRNARYRDGGRGELVGGIRLFDCYGFLRAVRAEQYGLPTMPALASVDPKDPRQVHRASAQAVQGLSSCSPQPGAMALCWTGALALHCGVVVPSNGRLGVQECHETAGIRWQPLRAFCNDYTAVEYYT